MAHGLPLVPIVVPDPYAIAGIVLTWTASDAGGNSVELTGREILLAWNDTAGAETITIDSVEDPFERTGHITADAIGIGAYRAYQLFPTRGWKQTDGLLHIDTSAVGVKLCVLRLPVDVK